jgi:hypothetical protein
MGVMEISREMLAAKYELIFPHLDERQRRLLVAAEARVLGHGGMRLVARAAGMTESTVSRGVAEMAAGGEPLGRARHPGAGRKRAEEKDPGLVPALLALVDDSTRGDPQSPLTWTTRSLRHLSRELAAAGHRCSPDTAGRLLHAQGFSLQATAKTMEGKQHPDRDAQFRYIAARAGEHLDAGQPVISVDAKKKEQVGNYARAGREWRRRGDPVQVCDHDFPPPGQQAQKVIPYGIYDIGANTGFVNVGTDHNTAAFAVESIRRWWHAAGQGAYPAASRLLITADAGGSNSYRARAWKAGLAELAAQTGLEITCCHFPPGTSKWNKIEHRLFSCITMNWRGRPLTSHQVIIDTIAATTTATGLTVTAQLDDGRYPGGIKITDAQMAGLKQRSLTPCDFHGAWNYTLHPPAPGPPPPGPPPRPARKPRLSQDTLSDPALTGMTRPELAALAASLATAWNASREAALYQRRGGPRRRAAWATHPSHAQLTLTEQILAALLHQRLALPRYLLAPLYGASASAISDAIALTGPLLDASLPPVQPAPGRAALLRRLCQHAETAGVTLPAKIKAAC